jgi:prolyl 4-hydroxylase
MKIKLINSEPLIIMFNSVFTDVEIDELNYKNLNYQRSLGFSYLNNKRVVTDVRTSSTSFDHKHNQILNDKIFNLISNFLPNIEKNNLENFQILRYFSGESYKMHYDYFNQFPRYVTRNDRIATCITYLNDSFIGGKTIFPKLNINVSPKKGEVLFFRYDYKKFITNSLTLHLGEEIILGEKYIASTWIRENPHINLEKNN